MTWLLRILGIWTIADAVFLFLAPRRWSRWWGRWVRLIGGDVLASRLFALIEVASGVYLIQRSFARDAQRQRSEVQGGGDAGAIRAAANLEKSWLITTLFRMPLPLYRLGLGWVLGHRFLLLTHRGRKSGRPYQTVLEVVHYDPATRESIVISGWGARADWYRNIRANPPIAVATGGDCFVPSYRELSADEKYPVVHEYLEKSPPIFRDVAERTLFGSDVTEGEKRDMARNFVMVAFRPAADQPTREAG